MSDRVSVSIWYDYACPFVYAASVLMRRVKQELGDQIDITWRYFSLEQANQTHGPDWKLWEQPESYPSRGRLAWKGAIAARAQGDEAFDRFHFGLLSARHAEGQDLSDRATIFAVAGDAGLDMERFERDFEAATLEPVGADHEEGVQTYGVFGTPTFVFANGQAAFLRLRPLPPEDELLAVWEQFKAIAADRPEIAEIKRPVPPAQ